ncbi:MAG: hypothetical protein HYX67_12450 [Candidatus Melainabacteria bacterium]|nr:hypothetical protein [Candidatus Melainabacteria bacterium]
MQHKTLISTAALCSLFINTMTLSSCTAQIAHTDKPAVTAEGKPTFWRWSDEQEWIIDSVGKDIAEMLVYAKYHNDPAIKLSASSLKFRTTTVDKKTNKYKFELVLPGEKDALVQEFTLNGYVWSPNTYQPFVKQLMESLKLKANPTSVTPENYLKILSDADMSELFAENDRISKALSETPLDPCLHEQAALLQATFAMLELAGNLSDTRAPLNRISAHLALAESIEGNNNLSLVGKVADIALESMSCRDGVAVSKNDDLAKSATDETLKSWLRALKIRSSGDYRIFDEKKQTQLEASQFGMRYANLLNADKMLDYIHAHKCTPPVRWMRIAICGQGSVASGHEVDSQITNAELGAFADDYKLYNKHAIDPQALVTELNKTSTRCLINDAGTPKLVVLSWGDVASYHARHVVNAVDQAYKFYEYVYAVKEMAAETLKKSTDLLGEMTLFPLALIDVKQDAEHKETTDKFYAKMEKLFVEHPELIQSYAWIYTKYLGKNSARPVEIQTPPELWFAPPYPMGTAFYFVHRLALDNCKPDLAELTRLRTLCPLDEGICWKWIEKKYGQNPTSAQLREGYGKLVDYDLQAMRYCSYGDYDDPAQYEEVMKKIAEINPENYLDLAYYFVQHNNPEKASEYFQDGIDKSQDAVVVANKSAWLVNYLYDKGEKDKALSIAKNAAEVYSMGGLCCLADLYDRMGELAKAEQLYVDANERYDNNAPLVGFYFRHASTSKKYADESARLLKKDFPAGLQQLELAKLSGPPKVGVKIVGGEKNTDSLGLKNDCIVVGLNNYKTDNVKQYHIVRRMTLNPNIKATFWDGKTYKQAVVHTVSGNQLGLTITDYPDHH